MMVLALVVMMVLGAVLGWLARGYRAGEEMEAELELWHEWVLGVLDGVGEAGEDVTAWRDGRP